MKEIQLTNELERFALHLKDNPRTILSSAFGNGKTTFIRQYIEKYKEEGEFIILHPVNYSCGTNEDVFEYVKRDILFQLANCGLLARIDLNAIEASLFTMDNIKELIGFLLSLAPGGDAMKRLWDKFQPWIDKAIKAKENYDSQQLTWEKYRNTFECQRGGIYERDMYTVLIEETLKNIHERAEGKAHSTLIIEDMDRIDPAHLFRILNVLGAHLDGESDNGNKFGFNNIILVMDYQTTEHIFHHFYGEKANYHGYMKKFISHHIFNFNIVEAAKEELYNLFLEKCSLDKHTVESFPIQYSFSRGDVILGTVINQLSVREIAQILDGLDNQFRDIILNLDEFTIQTKAPITYLLAVLVRTNRVVDYKGLFDYLKSKEDLVFKLLQQYLLCEKTFANGSPFYWKKEKKNVQSIKNADGTSSVSIYKVVGGYAENIHVDGLLRTCFERAMDQVKDCRN